MEHNKVIHKGWDWKNINSETWNTVSAEFLPISIDWASKFHSMVDIGAGKGRHSFYMNKLGLSVSAVDLSESSVEIIRQKNQEQGCSVEVFQSDMIKLPFADNQFDCAICFHTIYHTNLDGLVKSIEEIKRVLKSGGEVFITFNSKDNDSFKNGESVDNYTIYKTGGIENGIPHSYIDFDDLSWIMKGFKLIKVQQIRNFVYKEEPVGGNHYYVLARKL